MAKSYEMYVFDWDGTLMDTTRLIMQGYQHASKALGYPVPSDELVLSTIGLNRSDSIALCCCDCPKGRYSEFIQAYICLLYTSSYLFVESRHSRREKTS